MTTPSFITYHTTFFANAVEFYESAFELNNSYEEELSKLRVNKDDDDAIITIEKLFGRNISSILFSSLTVEAFINHYIIEHKSKSYLKNYLDKLNVVGKWLIGPQIILGKSIPEDCKAIQGLKKLVSIRDKLVHFKSVKIENYDNINPSSFFFIEDARIAIETVILLGEELQKIDPRLDINWLFLAKNLVQGETL